MISAEPASAWSWRTSSRRSGSTISTDPFRSEARRLKRPFWTLRIMQGLPGSTDPTDIAALRAALAEQFSSERWRDAA
jgi:hypothetical protein